jgi:hypothetical protein
MRALIAATGIAALTACGGTSVTGGGTNREWIDNTSVVIDQLVRDVALAAGGGDTVAAAGTALRDPSSLYPILVAYTDFGGCRHMAAAAGEPPARFAGANRSLGSACTLLEDAAALFTRAATQLNALALVAAERATQRASPFLLRAKAELGTPTSSSAPSP